jgi:hypothetical protein
MRTKSRTAAMKEYLTAAVKMVAKMSTSGNNREVPDQASAPESTTAAALAGCGDNNSPHRISDSAGKDGGAPLSPESARATVRGRGDGTGAAAADRASRWGQRRWDGGGGG